MKRDMKKVKRTGYVDSVLDYLHETKLKFSPDNERNAFPVTPDADDKSSVMSCVDSRIGKETERKATSSRSTEHNQ